MQGPILLNDGHKIPRIGFGTYKATDEEGVASVKTALQSGYRLIDTAAKYENEKAVGEGIKASEVPREELFITTKLWRENLGYAQAKKAFAESLKRLNLKYIDLYLIHWPANAKNHTNWQKTNAETWRALEDLQSEGTIKSIGVSNFWPEHLEPLLETARVKTAVNQIEFHPGYWQQAVTEYCKAQDIVVESWSPLGQGRVFGHPVLEKVAKKHNKSVAQICLRWIYQHDVVVIPKSTTPERIKENKNILDFELSVDEMRTINEIPKMGFSGELPNEWPDKV
ncbi:aldo/keto reductase [Flavimarina sp. Hel_I_48]|uniref:aldo/keto reductase n=1 Tax=Flavimarina sp. Hel_I_48 TaxID=1392488 RepID=UPI0004DF14D8|nr:aldo/keto reductase [Flavimarina sp. Hel_I_48]